MFLSSLSQLRHGMHERLGILAIFALGTLACGQPRTLPRIDGGSDRSTSDVSAGGDTTSDVGTPDLPGDRTDLAVAPDGGTGGSSGGGTGGLGAGGRGQGGGAGTVTGGAGGSGTGGSGAGGNGAGGTGAVGGGTGGSGAGGNGAGGSGSGGTCGGTATPPSVPTLLRPMRGFYSGSLHAPANVATLRPTFTWSPVASTCGALTYEIQLDNSCAAGSLGACTFPSPEVNATGLTQTSYAPAQSLPVSTAVPVGAFYAWRVRACDGALHCSAWSEVRYLHVGSVREDVNGDGYGDLLGWNGDGLDAYLGGAQFVGTGPAAHITIPNACSGATTFLGDVNGDGFGDFLAMENYAPTAGCVPVLFYGGATVTALQSLLLTKTAGGPSTIMNLRSAGDFNGDGYADLIIQWAYGVTTPKAQVRIFWGGSAISTNPDLTIPGPYDNFEGFSDSGRLGDLNGDGYEDVGLFAFDLMNPVGKMQIFFGGPAPDTTADGEVMAAQAPGKIGPAGDVNGDGYDDALLLVGNNFGLLRGGPSPAGPLSPMLTATSPNSILGGFDIDGDHFSDFAVGLASSSLLLYRGGATPTLVQNGLSHCFGSPVTFSDHDGDGRADIVITGNNVQWAGSDGTTDPRPQQIFALTGDVTR